jgi:orotate phosphoribosyltransferase
MSQRRERIAELYFRSNSARFGKFLLSVHIDNPELPLSPYYLHYPKPGEPGAEHLPELFRLIGAEFHDIAESQDPPVRPRRLAGVPSGALPIADAYARKYSDYPSNLIAFRKIALHGQTIIEGPIAGTYEQGDELGIVDRGKK